MREHYKCFRSGYRYSVSRKAGAGRKLGHPKRLYCPLCGCAHNLYRVG